MTEQFNIKIRRELGWSWTPSSAPGFGLTGVSVSCQAEAAVLEGKSGRERERKRGSCSVVMSLESSSSQQSQNSTSASTSFKCIWTCKHAHEGLYQGQCCSQEWDQFQLLLKCWLALSLSLSRCPAFDSFLPGAVSSQFRASIKLCNFALPVW